MTHKTVGQISSELLAKQVDDTHSAHEQMEECLTDYEKNIYKCIEDHKKIFPKDFYIVVTTKKERLMPNVLRNYFTARQSCPTPEYDQTVYDYSRANEDIIFLWCIPSKDTCQYMRDNVLQIPTEEQGLLRFVLDFYDGSLLQLAKKLNNEEPDSNLLKES